MGLAELAGKVAWSAWRSLLLAFRTFVIDVDSTLTTEAVGLATLILARPFIEISSALVLLFLFLKKPMLASDKNKNISLLVDQDVFIINSGVFLPLGPRRR